MVTAAHSVPRPVDPMVAELLRIGLAQPQHLGVKPLSNAAPQHSFPEFMVALRLRRRWLLPLEVRHYWR